MGNFFTKNDTPNDFDEEAFLGENRFYDWNIANPVKVTGFRNSKITIDELEAMNDGLWSGLDEEDEGFQAF